MLLNIKTICILNNTNDFYTKQNRYFNFDKNTCTCNKIWNNLDTLIDTYFNEHLKENKNFIRND